MFDLEAAVRAWRREAELHYRGERLVLIEMEDHLREEFAALATGDRSPEEAWHLAVARLGDPAAIANEFAKIDRLSVIDRVALGIFAITAASLVAFATIYLVRAASKPNGDIVLAAHVLTLTAGYVLGLFAAAVAGYRTIRGLIAPGPVARLTRITARLVGMVSLVAATCTVLGIVFGAVWSNGRWGHYFRADPREIGALFVAASLVGVGIALCRGVASPRIPLAAAVCGGGIILAAWFGVVARAAGYPALPTIIGVGGSAIYIVLAGFSLLVRDVPADAPCK